MTSGSIIQVHQTGTCDQADVPALELSALEHGQVRNYLENASFDVALVKGVTVEASLACRQAS